jgi:iron complex outermembrane receptor protein
MRKIMTCLLLSTAFVPVIAAAAIADETGPSKGSDSTIVVTGERFAGEVNSGKSDIPLAELPQAISVVTAEQLEERGVTRLADALFSVAGAARSSTYGFYDAYSLRGFDAAYGSAYLDGLLNEAGGGGSNNELIGLESIEVVKGPASALFGSGPLGGIVNLVSKRPDDREDFLDVQLSTGSYNLVEGAIDANMRLDRDGALTARIVALYRDSDSFVNNAGYNRLYLQPSLSWRVGPDTRLTVIGTLKRDHDNPWAPLNAYGTVFPLGGGYRLPLDFAIGEDGDEKAVQNENRKTISAIFEHGFTDRLKLGTTARYMRRTTFWDRWMFAGDFLDEELDGDGNPVAGTGTTIGRFYYGPYNETFKSFLADSRLSWKVDTGPLRHNLLGGIDYRRTTSDYEGDGDFDQTHFPLNVYEPDYSAPLVPTPAPYTGHDRNRQLGFYVQDHIELGDRLTLTVNGRWDRAKSNGELQTAFSPRIGATWEAVPGVSFYANYAKSFTPQFGSQIVLDVGDDGSPSVIGQAPPERGRNIEAGAKFDIAAARLGGTVAIYQLTRANVLMTDPQFPLFSIVSGKQRSKGAELELHWRPDPSFGIDFAYTYVRGRYLEDEFSPPGTPLPNIPKHNATLFGHYRLQSGPLAGLGANLGLLYNSNRYTYDSFAYSWQDPMMALKSYVLVNGGLSYAFEGWEARINVNNIFDKRYYPDACCITRVTPGEPRNWRLTVSRRF